MHALVAVLAVGSPLALPSIAEATFPGTNGAIAFESWRGCSAPTTGPCADALELYAQLPPSRRALRLTANHAADAEPSWSADGTRLAFFSDRDGNSEIYVLDSLGERRLTTNAADDWDPSWSPDGALIVFTSARDGNPEIYVMDADGSDVTRLTFDAAFDEAPAFSPDGSLIAWSRGGDLYTMTAEGGAPTALTSTPSLAETDPDWSPDGTRLVFTCQTPLPVNVCVMNRDGTGFVSLTASKADERNLDPVWSPDGTKIAYVSEREHGPTLAVMNADGSRQQDISTGFDRYPSWQPLPHGGMPWSGW
jgi:Tol biopolymer transport system component